MKIDFPDDQPVYQGADPAVHFVARVDGKPVACAVTAEALEDHFGAHSAYEWDLMAAYDKGVTRIREVAVRALRETGGKPIVLHSGMFRIDAPGAG